MKKLIATVFTLYVLSLSGYSYQVTTITPLPPQDNYGYNSYPKVSQVENILFKQSFDNEDIYYRLNRIEQKMFKKTNTNLSLAERLDYVISRIDPAQMYNIPLDGLAKAEYKIFNRQYPNDDLETRIIRLEKEMLGAMQSGNLDERYEVVASAAKHYNAFPYTDQQPFGQQPYTYGNTMANGTSNAVPSSTGGVKGVFQNILGAMIGGTLTGYTPPMYNNPQNYNSSYYQNSNYPNSYYPSNNWSQNLIPQNSAGFNNYMQSNRGYYNSNRDYGSGSGVHVLYD